MIETILCAAIWYNDGKEWPHQPKNVKTGVVICGHRHPSCFVQLSILYKVNDGYNDDLRVHILQNNEQGFLTSANRFVNREEAGRIAIASGQIKSLRHLYNELDSSDLY